jgi:hypothetical protein
MSQAISGSGEPSKLRDPRASLASFRTQLALDRTTRAWIRTTQAVRRESPVLTRWPLGITVATLFAVRHGRTMGLVSG